MQEQKPKSVKNRIIEAIKNNDLATLESELRKVNFMLTGFDYADFAPNAKDELRQTLNQFLANAKKGYGRTKVYLGDGGISRLALRSVDGKVTVDPTDNSSKDVKQKWVAL